MATNPQDVIKLCRLAQLLATRFGGIGTDEMGDMLPEDRKLMESVNKQADKVLSSGLKSWPPPPARS